MNDRELLSNRLSAGFDPELQEAEKLDFSDIPDGNWRLGGYELLEEIGRGGMGIIYRARQPKSNRIVALKRLLPLRDGDTEAAQRLQREAETVASLDHPNILPIYEVGTGEDGLPFFSMKLAGGGCLTDHGRPSTRDSVLLMAKVARAMQYAHGKDVLHRDLKPGNILLDGQGEPLVADFGLAKWLDRPSDLTQSLTVFGTPGYLAPEQAVGKADELGRTADIYSLGAILFELLSGRPPFVGSNAWAVVKEASETPAPKLRTLVPEADRDLETICARCLEREPAARYQNAGDVADDLQRWLDGRPIIARPVSRVEQGWRWVRRNRILSATGLLCLVLAGTGIVWTLQMHNLEEKVRQQDLASHAVTVLPILDLDEVSASSRSGTAATNVILKSLQDAGRQIKPLSSQHGWTKTFAAEAKAAGAPHLVAGVTRKTASGRKFALQWFDVHQGRFTRRIIGFASAGNTDPLPRLVNELLTGGGEHLEESDPQFTTANPEARDLLAAGEEYYSRFTVEALDQTIACARKALQADPKATRGYTLLALALMNRSWYGVENPAAYQAQADAAIAKAIELAPNSAPVYQAKANVAFLVGRLEEGSEAIHTYFELSMDVANTARTIGCIQKLYGQTDRALNWFSLLKIFAKSQDYLSLIADAYADLGMDEESAAQYQKFVDLFPDKPDGRLGLCELKLLHGDFAEGRAMIEELLRDFPKQSYPPLIAAQEALYSRDYPRAAALYGKLMESDRKGGSFFYGSISYLSGRGFALLQMGQVAEGRQLLEEARDIEKVILGQEANQPDHLNSLAATEAALGNPAVAYEIFEKYLPIIAVSRRLIERDPRYDALRSDPRFQKNLQAMNAHIVGLQKKVRLQTAPPQSNQQ
ncbi:MAG TPA: protein kinase [Chthoniobacteraceae bacterium]|jgi:tetratricopeptide (TPR) repeat protein/tRNA A-37 threonylcarbamoyl transferase component Bud32